jgi:3-deoxy-D-manno-octulosonic-acid transferase
MLQDVAADCALTLYRLAGRAGAPLVRGHLRRRARRGREEESRLGERLGRALRARPAGRLVWLHAASVGEALSSLPLIERLRAEWPDFTLLLTTGTVTSAGLMAERLPAGVIHQYAPVDLPAAVEDFLAHWRPDLGLILESELWPNLLSAAARRGVELVLVNGRISADSYRSWRRCRPLARRLLGGFALVLAQSPADRERLEALGAAAPRCLGNLKFAAAAPPADADALAALAGQLSGRPCWLAASTHPGEETIAARVHRVLAAKTPDLVTVIVPRHPERAQRIVETLARSGARAQLRSRTPDIGPGTGIYLADTMGELGLWYRLAQVVFVGGSLVAKGGQTLIEPARLGAAILTGPDTSNFAQVAEDMRAAGALGQVGDGRVLAAEVDRLLADPGARSAMGRAAETYVGGQSGVLEAVTAALAPSLERAARSACSPLSPATRSLIGS